MDHIIAAGNAFFRIKAHYRGSLKSGNKMKFHKDFEYAGPIFEAWIKQEHLAEGKIEIAQQINNARAARGKIFDTDGSEKGYISVTNNPMTYGYFLDTQNAKSMNCEELTCLSMWATYNYLNKPAVIPIARVSLEPPADHVFCLVGNRDNLQKCHGVPVSNLASVPGANQIAVVDVWLNIYCPLDRYPDRAKLQLDKWQSKNKRVWWTGKEKGSIDPPLGEGWYAPKGMYEEQFEKASLIVSLAQLN